MDKKRNFPLFLSAAAFLLMACSSVKAPQSLLNKVYITNTKSVYPLPPSSIPRDSGDCWYFQGQFNNSSLNAVLYMEQADNEIQLLLLNEMGLEAAEIHFTSTKCTIESPFLPEKLKGEYIVLDFQNAFAPLNMLENHYKKSGLTFTEEKTENSKVRKLYSGKKLIEEITETKKTVTIKNYYRKYTYILTLPEEF